MESFCRGCLIKYDEPGQLLQYTEKNRRLFVYSTGLQVKRNDTLTFQLCKECHHNMKLSCKFKKLCRTSDKRFKNYLGLKNAGDTVDFCTFLKNSDDTLTFRLPLMSGNSTPANQKGRDDDNESTCTSIRNFMTDILQGEEMPDSEARIIREVIEEEADVLDDSLDSHWLQDDVSVDTDFRLDFSFSPFTTPRSENNDQYYTPKKFSDQKEDHDYYESNLHKSNQIENAFKHINGETKEEKDLEHNYESNFNELVGTDDIDGIVKADGGKILNVQNFYVPNEDLGIMDSNIQIDTENITVTEKQCTIDRNLEKALQNADNKEFSLDNLLVSPPVFQGVSGASTPTINNILFGTKLDSPMDSNRNVGKCIETYESIKPDIDILDEFFNNSRDDEMVNNNKNNMDANESCIINDEVNQIEHTEEDNKKEDIYDSEILNGGKENDIDSDALMDLENLLCKLCNKQYRTVKGLAIHCTKTHNTKIIRPKIKVDDYVKLCSVCGKEFHNRSNHFRHMKTHEKSPKPAEIHKCPKCPLVCTTETKLKMHMVKHNVKYVRKETGKKYICNICGATSNSIGNFRLHQRRHAKEYNIKCDECGKGFYRASELVVHKRMHTGERPYPCTLCPKTFARRDGLAKHIHWHTAEEFLECEHCDAKFITKSELKHHLKYSKKCYKSRVRLAELQDDGGKIPSIGVIYIEGNEQNTKNELPFLDTEVSN